MSKDINMFKMTMIYKHYLERKKIDLKSAHLLKITASIATDKRAVYSLFCIVVGAFLSKY